MYLGVAISSPAFFPHPLPPIVEPFVPQRGVKRRRLPDVPHDVSLEPFDILPYVHSHLDRPVTARPLLLLPRAQLPLHLIDTRPVTIANHATRMICADIASLNLPSSDHDGDTPQVLVVQLGSEASLCAIERVDDGIHSICRLTRSTSIDALQALGSACNASLLRNYSRYGERSGGSPWWSIAMLRQDKLPEDLPLSSKTRNTPFSDPIVREHPLAAPVELAEVVPSTSTIADIETVESQLLDAGGTQIVEETYAVIVAQYVDTLYRSKTSLAYFAKGPLSRARAACAQSLQDAEGQTPLHDFLRQLILSMSILEKKHKETLPAIIKVQNSNAAEASKARKRKSRKLKVGKDGLFPGEQEALESWWLAEDIPASLKAETMDAHVKARIGYLRVRENLLQLILVLETMALEASLLHVQTDAPEDQLSTGDTQLNPDSRFSFRRKGKKAIDLYELVDTLIDRLTIWQSIETVESVPELLVSADDVDDIAAAGQTLRNSSDQLKDFATEVVIPFYAARLPEIVQRLARRLGVSTGRSPPKRKASKHKVDSAAPIPGARLRQFAKNSVRKPLPRADSDSFRRPFSRTPSLMRSATDSFLESQNRERSATPQLSFDGTSGKRSLSRANSINHAKDLHQREVDFGVISKFNEAKSRKKANVEQELQEAIATLKRPNRGLAVKEFVDASDSRKIPITSQAKKPTTSSIFSNIAGAQIKATPKRQRKTKDMVIATPSRIPEGGSNVPEPVITSSYPCVPSSTLRSNSLSDTSSRSLRPVFETPSKSRKNQYQLDSGCDVLGARQLPATWCPESSPVVPMQTPPTFKVPWRKPFARPHEDPASGDGAHSIHDTPTKQWSPPHFADDGRVETLQKDERSQSRPLVADMLGEASNIMAASHGNIYDSLGWGQSGDDY